MKVAQRDKPKDQSLRAKRLAHEIVLGNHKSKKEAMRKAGYSEIQAKNPQQIMETIAYKEAVEPLRAGLEKEIERAKYAILAKDLEEVPYLDIVRAMDILIKNHRLLTGNSTENVRNIVSFDNGQLQSIAERIARNGTTTSAIKASRLSDCDE